MGNLPLHPLLVHFPLVLAMLLPAVAALIVWADWRGKASRRSWWIVTATAALLTAASVASLKTGQREGDRVEHVVPDAALERHEERAELFTWTTATLLALVFAAGIPSSPRLRRGLGLVATSASLAVALLALGVGHSGGTLVYRHNAAAAYTATGAGASLRGEPRDRHASVRDGDDDRR